MKPLNRYIGLAVVVAALGCWVYIESHRGWTVGKLERLIEAEFDPTWDGDAVCKWADACITKYGFQRGYGHAGIFVGRGLLDQGWSFLNWRITPKDGSNLGILKSGEIQVYFLFHDNGSNFVCYRIYTIEGANSKMAAERHPNHQKFK